MSLPRVVEIDRSGTPAEDFVELTYDGRMMRRKRVRSASGTVFLVDLPETASLRDGEAFVLPDGTRIAVRAAQEQLLRIVGADLIRIAWHIGNRHCPCQIEAGYLLIRNDPVIAAMVRQIGGQVSPFRSTFDPEGGAYGHGRTLPHAH
ncbi:MAG: urease accessory protein UreE [Pseudomonadota bacterium]